MEKLLNVLVLLSIVTMCFGQDEVKMAKIKYEVNLFEVKDSKQGKINFTKTDAVVYKDENYDVEKLNDDYFSIIVKGKKFAIPTKAVKIFHCIGISTIDENPCKKGGEYYPRERSIPTDNPGILTNRTKEKELLDRIIRVLQANPYIIEQLELSQMEKRTLFEYIEKY